MKTMNMISRRNFLKAALGAAAVSAFSLTGCGGSASSAASGTASSAAASSAAASAEAGQTFKVGIVNYVDHASLNQIVASVESRLDEVGREKGVTFDYADYYANAQADQTNLNQIGADLVADDVDVIVAVATPTAATMLASVEDTDIPVVYSAVTDPVSAGFDGEENITGTSDALNTDAIMNLILAVNPDIDTIGLLYDLSQDASTQAIADAKAFCDSKGIKYIEKNGTTTAEVQMAAEALVAAGVKAVFTPTDNTVMTAELSIYETFTDAGILHFTGADSFALNGAFVGYGVDYVQLGEATADMVVELLCEGKTTADLPYQTFDNGIVTINTDSDRRAVQDELDQLNKEVDRIAYTTHFNQQYMLAEGTPQAAPGYYRIQSGALNGQAIDIHFVNASKESLGTDKVNVSSHAKASESITMVQDAIEQAALWRDEFGSQQVEYIIMIFILRF